ncbi:hypothetical protein M3M33_13930, partial [Loigolactobacillus coryniformis]|uniref:hypothetical protein n=1 Tax=Loigolactobacillus coryniformis TaxID=1610 RepID=UPI00201ADE3B
PILRYLHDDNHKIKKIPNHYIIGNMFKGEALDKESVISDILPIIPIQFGNFYKEEFIYKAIGFTDFEISLLAEYNLWFFPYYSSHFFLIMP